jgi:hypothetical protein
LEDLGYDSQQVARDVVAHKVGGIFARKYARLDRERFARYESSFTGGHYDSVNGKYDAFLSISRDAGGGSFQLKYYPSRDNRIGIVQAGLGHYFEVIFDGFDGFLRDSWGFPDNTIYHMHEGNALYYLLHR